MYGREDRSLLCRIEAALAVQQEWSHNLVNILQKVSGQVDCLGSEVTLLRDEVRLAQGRLVESLVQMAMVKHGATEHATAHKGYGVAERREPTPDNDESLEEEEWPPPDMSSMSV